VLKALLVTMNSVAVNSNKIYETDVK